MRYLSNMKYNIKIATKKLLGITMDNHLSFNDHVINVCKSPSAEILAENQYCTVHSVFSSQTSTEKIVSNSFVERDFSYCPLITSVNLIRSYRKVNKLHERSLQLCQNDLPSIADVTLHSSEGQKCGNYYLKK